MWVHDGPWGPSSHRTPHTYNHHEWSDTASRDIHDDDDDEDDSHRQAESQIDDGDGQESKLPSGVLPAVLQSRVLNEGQFGAALTVMISGHVFAVKIPKTAETYLPGDFVREVFIAQAFVNGNGQRTSRYALPLRDVFVGPRHTEADDDQPAVHLVYDLASQGDLASWIQSANPPSVDQLFNVLLLVLSGVEDLHLHGIVIGDLKPSNILIHEGWPFIGDFGGSGFIGNVEPDIVDMSYCPPEDRVRDISHDLWCYHRVIQRSVDMRRDISEDTLLLTEVNCQQAGFSEAQSRVLCYLFHIIESGQVASATTLLQDIAQRFGVQPNLDVMTPAVRQQAQMTVSPFVDGGRLYEFMARHRRQRADGPEGFGIEVQRWISVAAEVVIGCFSGHRDMATYLMGRDPVPFLIFLSSHIIHSIIVENKLDCDLSAVVAAIQIATHILGQTQHGRYEQEMIHFILHNLEVDSDITLPDVSEWQKVILIGLMFGPVSSYVHDDWSQRWQPPGPAPVPGGLRQLYKPMPVMVMPYV